MYHLFPAVLFAKNSPVASVIPEITGTPSITNVLSVSNGTWTYSPVTYGYQWKRDGVNISGANANTYTLVDADAGNDISCTVTAWNLSGGVGHVTTAATTIDWPSLASMGTLFTDNFNRATPGSNYNDATTGVTWSQNSTYLRATRATTGGFTDYITLNYPSSSQGVTAEAITYELTFRIVSSNVGLSIGWRSIGGNSNITYAALMVTGASGYGSQYHNGSELGGSGGRTTPALATANGNQVKLKIERRVVSMDITIYLLNGSGGVTASRTKTYDFPTSTAPLALNVSHPTIWFNGGTYDLEKFEVISGMYKYTRVAFVGNSITQWYNTTDFHNRFANLCMAGGTYSTSYIVLAGQGQRTEELLKNTSEIIALRPRYVVLDIGTNDIGTGVASATWQANYSQYVETLILAGIRVVLLYVTPRDGYDFRPTTVGSPNKWIADTYSSDTRVIVIDTYTPLKASGGNGIDAAYSSDGLHPNDTGMDIIADTIRAAIPTILGI